MRGVTTSAARDHRRHTSLVLKRAALKLVGYGLISAGQGLSGHGFFAPLAIMALVTALVCVVVATLRRERATAPHLTGFDEAAWFSLLGFVLKPWT